jgi:adenylate cyclase, class 2
MLEIEAKYPVSDLIAFQQKIESWGAKRIEEREDADHYFSAPDRDFVQTDEAFRIRRIGERTFLTYKGPKRDTTTKTRKEIEVPVMEGEKIALELIQLVQHLGYRPVEVVHKKRTIYEILRNDFHLHISLDRVDHVGEFVEVEIVAEEEKYEVAKETLLQVANELGLKDSERRSYLSLLLAKK